MMDSILETEAKTRRSVLRGCLGAAALGGGGLLAFPTGAVDLLPLTPSCDDHPPSTTAMGPGPFYTPNSPRKRDFRGDAPGTPVAFAGFVVDSRCRPVARAMVDLWHADASGDYDNSGFRLRGHQITGANGWYLFETIEPADYSGRVRHFHVTVRPEGGEELTTQLFFPGVPGNERDFLFDRRLLLTVRPIPGGKLGRFDFVLPDA